MEHEEQEEVTPELWIHPVTERQLTLTTRRGILHCQGSPHWTRAE